MEKTKKIALFFVGAVILYLMCNFKDLMGFLANGKTIVCILNALSLFLLTIVSFVMIYMLSKHYKLNTFETDEVSYYRSRKEIWKKYMFLFFFLFTGILFGWEFIKILGFSLPVSVYVVYTDTLKIVGIFLAYAVFRWIYCLTNYRILKK